MSDLYEQGYTGKTAGDPAVKDHLKVLTHSCHIRENNQNFFIVELFDLSVWPNDLNLLGGWAFIIHCFSSPVFHFVERL